MSLVDVGSDTVRLVVADAEGGVPLPAHTAKWRLRLSEQMPPGGAVPDEALRCLSEAVAAGGPYGQAMGSLTSAGLRHRRGRGQR